MFYLACKRPGHCVTGQKLAVAIAYSQRRLKGCGTDCNIWINNYCCKTTVDDKDVCCNIAGARGPSFRCYDDSTCVGDSDTCLLEGVGPGLCRCGTKLPCGSRVGAAGACCRNGECVPC